MNRALYFFFFLTIPVGDMAGEVARDPATKESLSDNRFLILRNGQVFEGQIDKQGNDYFVRLHNGRIRVQATDVEFVCQNLAEAYQRMKAVAQGGNLQNHLQLAQWCQRQGLKAQAAEELAVAEAIAPQHPLVLLFKRKLTTPAPPAAKKPSSAAAVLPSDGELDRLVRSLPPKTVEIYTRSVQPLLLNNCTAGGCHGPQSAAKLRLLRAPQGQMASRRLTQRNLYAVLQYIDQKNPAESPLLKVPAGPHGKLKTPIFNEHQTNQYRKIVDWAMHFNPSASPSPPAEVPASEVLPASHEEPVSEADPPAPEGAAPPLLAPPSSPKLQRGAAEPPAFTPQDEFDPEIFNRRHFGPAPSPAES
ncbi:MAG: hypothetical protein JXB10_04380 [Pirellulales bacterium]|nr:hypothetical protein [Pirellulales bacterium]